LLFYGNFIGITLRNVPSSWNLSDVDITVRQKLSQPIKDSFKNIFFLPKNADQTNKTARILFNDPYKAATALQVIASCFAVCKIYFVIKFGASGTFGWWWSSGQTGMFSCS
jgi:hypothetical protein